MKARGVLTALVMTLSLPAAARADGLITPFVGSCFGGASVDQRLTYGASFAFMGSGILGLEADFGYTPNFFGTDDFDLVDDSNVTTLMVNLIVGVPIGGTSGPGVRPYVSGGAGLLRTNVTDVDEFFKVRNNHFGLNVGAGLTGFFNDHIGLRGDVRYFRSLQDPDEDNEFDIDFGGFDFWRATGGVTFRF